MIPSAYNNMQLFQTAAYVVILNEMVHDARIVPLDARHPGAGGVGTDCGTETPSISRCGLSAREGQYPRLATGITRSTR